MQAFNFRKMRKNLLYIGIAALLSVTACAPQKQLSSNYTYKTQCVGVELDGSQQVLAWSSLRVKNDAIEEAKKNAVRDLLFSGITDGKPDCDVKPVLAEANALANHQAYFARFFVNDFRSYVILLEERTGQKAKNQKVKNVANTNGYVVRVNRPELKKRMIADGILILQ